MKKQYIAVILVSVISLFLFWAPFLLRTDVLWGIEFARVGMDTIVANFDGLNFIVVERTWYSPNLIQSFNASFLTGNDPIYFSAHYPGYAFVIWLFDRIMNGPQALLSSIIASNILLGVSLYAFFYSVISKKNAWWLSIILLFLPARMLSVRAVGSSEPLFISLILLSLLSHVKKKHVVAGILGALAVLVRGPGILLFGAYAIHYLIEGKYKIKDVLKSLIPYAPIPLSMVGLWLVYGVRYGNFLAYFNSGDNIHLFFPPFQVFSNQASWVSGMWLDDIIYVYLLFAVGVIMLHQRIAKSKRAVAIFPIIYMISVFFIVHRDIARYSLPVAPFVIAAFAPYLSRRWVKWLIVVLIVPIYLVGWNFVLQNVQPVNDWRAFL